MKAKSRTSRMMKAQDEFGEEKFWRAVSLRSMKRARSRKDKIWDVFAPRKNKKETKP